MVYKKVDFWLVHSGRGPLHRRSQPNPHGGWERRPFGPASVYFRWFFGIFLEWIRGTRGHTGPSNCPKGNSPYSTYLYADERTKLFFTPENNWLTSLVCFLYFKACCTLHGKTIRPRYLCESKNSINNFVSSSFNQLKSYCKCLGNRVFRICY